MTALKVGELYGELGIDADGFDKSLKQGKKEFEAAGRAMDAMPPPRLDIDTAGLEAGLAGAKRDARGTKSEIDQVAPKLDGSRIGSEVSQGLDGAQGDARAGASRIGDVIKAGIVGGVAGAGAIALDVFEQAMERNSSGAKLGGQLGLPPEMAKALGKKSADMYAEGWGDDVGQINEAMRGVATGFQGLGAMSKDEFDDLTRSGVAFAQTFDTEISGPGGVLTAASQMFKTGLAKDGREAMDILARGEQILGAQNDDLLDTFKEYSTQFRDLGLDGRTALGLINQAVKGGGRDTDIAADALKEFNIRAKDTGSDAAAAFWRMGLNGEEMTKKIAAGGPQAEAAMGLVLVKLGSMKDGNEKAALATALFGTQSEDLQKALNAMNVSTAVASLGQVDGAMKGVQDSAKNSDPWEQFKRELDNNAVSFMNDSVIPAFKDAQKWWTDNIGTVEDMKNGWHDFSVGMGEVADKVRWVKDYVLDPVIGTVQTLTDKLSGFMDNELVKGAMSLGGGTIGLAGNVGKLLGFDDGGVVPGPVGAPRVILAHGGETVVPTHKSGGRGPGVMGATRSGRSTFTSNLYLDGQVVARSQQRRDYASR